MIVIAWLALAAFVRSQTCENTEYEVEYDLDERYRLPRLKWQPGINPVDRVYVETGHTDVTARPAEAMCHEHDILLGCHQGSPHHPGFALGDWDGLPPTEKCSGARAVPRDRSCVVTMREKMDLIIPFPGTDADIIYPAQCRVVAVCLMGVGEDHRFNTRFTTVEYVETEDGEHPNDIVDPAGIPPGFHLISGSPFVTSSSDSFGRGIYHDEVDDALVVRFKAEDAHGPRHGSFVAVADAPFRSLRVHHHCLDDTTVYIQCVDPNFPVLIDFGCSLNSASPHGPYAVESRTLTSSGAKVGFPYIEDPSEMTCTGLCASLFSCGDGIVDDGNSEECESEGDECADCLFPPVVAHVTPAVLSATMRVYVPCSGLSCRLPTKFFVHVNEIGGYPIMRKFDFCDVTDDPSPSTECTLEIDNLRSGVTYEYFVWAVSEFTESAPKPEDAKSGTFETPCNLDGFSNDSPPQRFVVIQSFDKIEFTFDDVSYCRTRYNLEMAAVDQTCGNTNMIGLVRELAQPPSTEQSTVKLDFSLDASSLRLGCKYKFQVSTSREASTTPSMPDIRSGTTDIIFLPAWTGAISVAVETKRGKPAFGAKVVLGYVCDSCVDEEMTIITEEDSVLVERIGHSVFNKEAESGGETVFYIEPEMQQDDSLRLRIQSTFIGNLARESRDEDRRRRRQGGQDNTPSASPFSSSTFSVKVAQESPGGEHEFSPASANVTADHVSSVSLPSPVVFRDESSFAVHGHVGYANTACGVEGVQVCVYEIDATTTRVDGSESCVTTDSTGAYSLSAATNTNIEIVARFDMDHLEVSEGRLLAPASWDGGFFQVALDNQGVELAPASEASTYRIVTGPVLLDFVDPTLVELRPTLRSGPCGVALAAFDLELSALDPQCSLTGTVFESFNSCSAGPVPGNLFDPEVATQVEAGCGLVADYPRLTYTEMGEIADTWYPGISTGSKKFWARVSKFKVPPMHLRVVFPDASKGGNHLSELDGFYGRPEAEHVVHYLKTQGMTELDFDLRTHNMGEHLDLAYEYLRPIDPADDVKITLSSAVGCTGGVKVRKDSDCTATPCDHFEGYDGLVNAGSPVTATVTVRQVYNAFVEENDSTGDRKTLVKCKDFRSIYDRKSPDADPASLEVNLFDGLAAADTDDPCAQGVGCTLDLSFEGVTTATHELTTRSDPPYLPPFVRSLVFSFKMPFGLGSSEQIVDLVLLGKHTQVGQTVSLPLSETPVVVLHRPPGGNSFASITFDHEMVENWSVSASLREYVEALAGSDLKSGAGLKHESKAGLGVLHTLSELGKEVVVESHHEHSIIDKDVDDSADYDRGQTDRRTTTLSTPNTPFMTGTVQVSVPRDSEDATKTLLVARGDMYLVPSGFFTVDFERVVEASISDLCEVVWYDRAIVGEIKPKGWTWSSEYEIAASKIPELRRVVEDHPCDGTSSPGCRAEHAIRDWLQIIEDNIEFRGNASQPYLLDLGFDASRGVNMHAHSGLLFERDDVELQHRRGIAEAKHTVPDVVENYDDFRDVGAGQIDKNLDDKNNAIDFSGGTAPIVYSRRLTQNIALDEARTGRDGHDGRVILGVGVDTDSNFKGAHLFKTALARTGAHFGLQELAHKKLTKQVQAAVEVTFSLADPDVGDHFTVSVWEDERFGTPVFKTEGGESSCAAEEGTLSRYDFEIVDPPRDELLAHASAKLAAAKDLGTAVLGQRVQFPLVVDNNREEWLYVIRKVFGHQIRTGVMSNDYDLWNSQVDVRLVGEGMVGDNANRPAKIVLPGESSVLLIFEATSSVPGEYHFKIEISPECEFGLLNDVNTGSMPGGAEAGIFQDAEFRIEFVEACPGAELVIPPRLIIADPVVDFRDIFFVDDDNPTMITIRDLSSAGWERSSARVESVLLKYRFEGGIDSVAQMVIPGDDDDSQEFNVYGINRFYGTVTRHWDISGLSDGFYRLFVEVTCASQTVESPSVLARIDRTQARLMRGRPGDRLHRPGGELALVFSEAVRCGADCHIGIRTQADNSPVANVHYEIHNREIEFALLRDRDWVGDAGSDTDMVQLVMFASGLSDIHGNVMDTPAEFVFSVDRAAFRNMLAHVGEL